MPECRCPMQDRKAPRAARAGWMCGALACVPRRVKREHVGGVRACLRVWPQVDVVLGHEALPVVELSCVPVRVILHVGDLDTQERETHMRL